MDKTPHPSKVHFSALPLASLDGVSGIVQPETQTHSVTLESPAVLLVTDFSVSRPHTLPTSSSVDQALETMKQAGVRLLMLINPEGRFTGVVNARELIGGRRVTLAMQQHQIGRDEVTAEMIQTPRSELHALSYSRVSHASVGDLVETLKSSGDQHVLVTEPDGQGIERIRGMISASDISRALSVDFNHPPEARTFASICKVIRGYDL
ncbi:CBS domain-containing protein [Salinicola endophyticus]|uniref:CBS domain-containing protein n=1 Tax=Salinicola endophyticus TaxID=1949083 RepID=A0ABY8FSD5_9GAMM|nr:MULTISPECIES: CBS domain-containing protein [Salinicola]WFF42774.1 CBS domain-containing protein [Salinicola endophyticus]